MTSSTILDRFVADGNGYLQTETVVKHGISKPELASYVQTHQMERVAHGLYLSPDAWPDEFFQVSAVNRRAILSHETALSLHGLTEREPFEISVTVPAGYNASHLRKKGVRVYQARQELYVLGQTIMRTNLGNPVRSYDMERTICDCICHKEKMDIQMFQYAIREYMRHPKKNLAILMDYAKKMRIEPAVRTYTEMLL